MAKKESKYRGKSPEELKSISLKEFAALVNSRERRKLMRGLTDAEELLMKKILGKSKNVKTHCRDMVIVPQMLDKTILVFNGKEFVAVKVTFEMLGHRLGEFAQTRKTVAHSAPGVGATRSSAAISVK